MTPNDLIGTKLGNYRLERVLGRGRMGIVYLARDEALLRPIAIKLLAWDQNNAQHHDPEAWLLAEARNIARVNHSAVIQVYGLARHGQHAYIAMEYVNGVSADRVVAERGPFAPAAATQILLQIAGALQAAHECGVIHRDVKPANILIRSDGSAKLGDFGMSVQRRSAADGVYEQQAGTPLYTAPELWGGAAAGPASDIYALGATYHFLLTGRPPFDAPDLKSLIEAHRTREPPLAELGAHVAAACVELIRRCLAKSPAARPASGQEVAWLARSTLRDIEARRRQMRQHSPTRLLAPQAESAVKRASTIPPRDTQPAVGSLSMLPSFASTAVELRSFLQRSEPVIQVDAIPDPQVASLLEELLAAAGHGRAAAWLDAAGRLDDSLAHRACYAFGALPSSQVTTNSAIEGLIEHFATHGGKSEPAPILVIETNSVRSVTTELEPLLLGARATGYFVLVVVAPLSGGLVAGAPLLQLPKFSPLDLLTYWRNTLAAARTPEGPVHVTPDAALLVHHETQGDLARVQQLATRTLEIVARQKARVVTSWHAWAAIRGLPSSAPAPASWPSAEVRELLNRQRTALGFDAYPTTTR